MSEVIERKLIGAGTDITDGDTKDRSKWGMSMLELRLVGVDPGEQEARNLIHPQHLEIEVYSGVDEKNRFVSRHRVLLVRDAILSLQSFCNKALSKLPAELRDRPETLVT